MPPRRIVAPPTAPPWTPPILTTNLPVPDPSYTQQTSSRVEMREITIPTPDGPRFYACGEQWLAGKVQYYYYDAINRPNELWYVLELCAGECDALLDVTCPGRSSLDNIVYYWYPGTSAGAVDSHLAAVDLTWNELFKDTCNVVVRLFNFSTYWGGSIPNLIFHMRTRKVINCDTGTRAYSTWVWDQWYDFVLWKEGKALPTARVDQAAFATAKAADIAAGRTFPCHTLLADASDPDDVVQTYRLIAQAFWFFERTTGKYTVVADRAGAAVAATYNDHQRSQAREISGGRSDTFERANKVTAWYTDTSTADRQIVPMSYPADDALIAEPIVEEEHRLPWIYDPSQVNRLLVYAYNALQFDLRVTGRWNALTEGRRLGDVVSQYLPKRGRTVTGRLVELTPRPDSTYDYTLLEHNELKFSGAGVGAPANTPSTFPDPAAAPANVDTATVTITEEPFTEQDSAVRTRGKIVLTVPNTALLDHVDIYVSVNGSDYRFDGRAPHGLAGTAVTYLFNNVMEIGVPYTFKFVSVSIFEIASAGSTKAKTFQGKIPIPSDPQGFTATANGTQAWLTWQPSADGDTLVYELRRGATTDTWATALYLGQTRSTQLFDTPPYGQVSRYFLKAIAAGGGTSRLYYSTNAVTSDLTLNAVGAQATEAAIDELVPAGSYTRVAGPAGDANVGLWYGSGQLIVEATRLAAGAPINQRLMLTRNFSPAAAEAERAAGGYASVGAWATAVDDPRRGGAPLWAPLPSAATGEIYGNAAPNRLQRLSEHRARLLSISHAGDDLPANTSWAHPLFLELAAPTARQYGNVYSATPAAFNVSSLIVRGIGVRLSSNASRYQQTVSSVGGSLMALATERRTFTIASGSSTTDGAGLRAITFAYSQLGAIPAGASWLTIRALPTAAGSSKVITFSIDTATQTITFRSFNADGTAAAAVAFSYEVIDNGGSVTAPFG